MDYNYHLNYNDENMGLNTIIYKNQSIDLQLVTNIFGGHTTKKLINTLEYIYLLSKI